MNRPLQNGKLQISCEGRFFLAHRIRDGAIIGSCCTGYGDLDRLHPDVVSNVVLRFRHINNNTHELYPR